MAGPDYDQKIKQLHATMRTIEQVLDVEAMRKEIYDLSDQVAAPDLWDDVEHATRVTGKLSGLQGEVDPLAALSARIGDLAIMVELGQDEADAALCNAVRRSRSGPVKAR